MAIQFCMIHANHDLAALQSFITVLSVEIALPSTLRLSTFVIPALNTVTVPLTLLVPCTLARLPMLRGKHTP